MSICWYDKEGLIRKMEVWEGRSADSDDNEDNPEKEEELAGMLIDCNCNRENEVIEEVLEEMSIC
jgi:hypothetical protein